MVRRMSKSIDNWKDIIYPPPLKKGDLIGVTAPSSGVPKKFHPRLELVLEHLEKRGFKYVEGKYLRSDHKGISADARNRAKDFMNLWNNPDVKAIIPPWGGELLINILPLLDFDIVRKKSTKWILGYSDTSTLLFSLTLLSGVASAHGMNLMDSVLEQKDGLSERTFNVLATREGNSITQESSIRHQVKFEDFTQNVKATFNLTHKTFWKSLFNKDNDQFSGRIIGGCLDTIKHLIGAKYGDLPQFISKFNKDKVILYLENAGLNPSEVCRSLWNMKLAGWFNGLSGVLLGRSAGVDVKSQNEFSYKDALLDVFVGVNFPVIYDCDIGHLPPQMTIINGSMAHVEFSDGKGKLIQKFC